jgi:hypothetical protein
VVLGLDYRGFFGNASSKGRGKKDTAVTALTEGSLAGLLARWWAGAGGLGPCRVSGGVEVIVRGAGLVKLRGGDGLLLLAQLDILHLLALLLLLLFYWCGGGKRRIGGAVARVSGGGLGVLKGRPKGLWRGPGRRGRRCPASVPRDVNPLGFVPDLSVRGDG